MAPFGFGPLDPDDENSGGPNFNEIFAGMQNFGFNPQALFAAASAGAPLISQETLREISRRVIKNDRPIGNVDIVASQEAFNLANTWLDQATLFPSTSIGGVSSSSRSDWLAASIPAWQKLLEPLADGMANALTEVLKETPIAEAPQMAHITPIMRAFMGSLIASALGQSLGEIATTITGSNDVAIPLGINEAKLIPMNIDEWAQGLNLRMDEVRIFLAVREAAATRLFTHTPWLFDYVKELITSYGRGIRIDMEAMQQQAMEAMESGQFDPESPESISIAISAGLFKPEQSAQQEAALAKLEITFALIEGWIDHVTTKAIGDRLPSFNSLSEMHRRNRVTKSPMQHLFATLLGLEVSPRLMRECANFWRDVDDEVGIEGRDHRFEDAALLPTGSDLSDAKKFLASTTVPDDISGLFNNE
jgi:putative hydrolase